MADKQWSASNYRQRKATRQAKVEPQWVTNPDTGEEFLLRRIGGMAYTIAGFMPRNMAADAVQSWAKEGVDVPPTSTDAMVQAVDVDDNRRTLEFMGRVVMEACIVPKLVIRKEGQELAADELDPGELDDSDVMFIFRWATGYGQAVQLKGGQAMPVGNLQKFPKKAGRRLRTGTDR
jgi:hypothetical protein